MGTTLGRILGTTLGTTAGGTQHTARSLVDRSWATNPARECSTGLADPDVAAAVSKFSTRPLRGVQTQASGNEFVSGWLSTARPPRTSMAVTRGLCTDTATLPLDESKLISVDPRRGRAVGLGTAVRVGSCL